jgi:hypothetical protein
MGRKGIHGDRDRRRDGGIPVLQGRPRCMHHILFCLTSVIDSYTTLNMVWDKCTIVTRLFAMCDTSHAMSSRQQRPLPRPPVSKPQPKCLAHVFNANGPQLALIISEVVMYERYS